MVSSHLPASRTHSLFVFNGLRQFEPILYDKTIDCRLLRLLVDITAKRLPEHLHEIVDFAHSD